MTDKNLICYHIAPMDFGWDALLTRSDYLAAMIKETPWMEDMSVANDVAEFEQFFSAALELARAHGWEGDFRRGNEPRVVVLPDESMPKLALVWKQDNNGTTFVVSQVPLPWLR